MQLYDTLKTAITDIVAEYKTRVADGSLSFSDALTLTYNATATFVRLAESAGSENSGPVKKQMVLQALSDFYDNVIAPLSLTGLPTAIETIVDVALKNLMLSLADAWVDSVVTIFRKSGWFTPDTTDTATQQLNAPLIY